MQAELANLREEMTSEFNVKLLKQEGRIAQLERKCQEMEVERANYNMVLNLLLRKNEEFERTVTSLGGQAGADSHDLRRPINR